MNKDEETRPMSGQDARQGVTPGVLRWMLLGGLVLVVVGLVVAFLVS